MGWRARVTMSLVLGVLTAEVRQASAQERPWSIGVFGNLTTSSQIYYNPRSSDPVERSQYNDLSDLFGLGIEVKYEIPETRLGVGLSVEHIRIQQTEPLPVSQSGTIPVDDGYEVIPVEITGYFTIPASGRTLGIFMGGGVGAYYGHRVYSSAGLEAALVSSRPGFGIHVCTGVNVHFTDALSVLAEMKFRDLQFESTNAFPVSRTNYQGSEVILPSGSLYSSIHTDGITFQIGAAFSF